MYVLVVRYMPDNNIKPSHLIKINLCHFVKLLLMSAYQCFIKYLHMRWCFAFYTFL